MTIVYTETDDDLLKRAMAAKNGEKFRRLWLGEWEALGEYPSQSEADAGFMEMLAFWTNGNASRMEAIFSRSLLSRPKWTERPDYRQSTIDYAITRWHERDRSNGHRPEHGTAAASADAFTPDQDDTDQNKPAIRVDDQHFDRLVSAAVAALVAANDPPGLFVRGGALARVCRDEDGRPIIAPHGADSLRIVLASAATWYQVVSKDRKPRSVTIPPPTDVVRSVLALGEWPDVPPLAGITQSPVLHADGTIHAAEGYDSVSALWYARPKEFSLPTIPATPTPSDVQNAVACIDDVFIDFPFLTDADRAAIWAAALTAVLRASIEGPTPLFIIDKPRAGTGASLLAEVIAMLATNEAARMKTLVQDRGGEETRKAITSALLSGSALIVLDNIDSAIASGHLAAAITARTWEDRILGKSEMVRLPVQVTWLATGNNVRVRGDIARRSLVCRLDARIERPWERTTFRHPNLIGHIRTHRGELLAAIFTIARAWIQAERPAGESATLGSFEAWSHTIGGLLRVAGVSGLLSNLASFYTAADEDWSEWAAFLHALHRLYGMEAFTTKEIADALPNPDKAGHDVLREALPVKIAAAIGKPTLNHSIGREFSAHAEARYDGLRLTRDGTIHKVARWRVLADPSLEPRIVGGADITDHEGGGLGGSGGLNATTPCEKPDVGSIQTEWQTAPPEPPTPHRSPEDPSAATCERCEKPPLPNRTLCQLHLADAIVTGEVAP